MNISDLHMIHYVWLFFPNPIFWILILMIREKEYFCSGNLKFFINDKQKIITDKSLVGSICF